MKDLGTLGGNFSQANAVNANGRIVGISFYTWAAAISDNGYIAGVVTLNGKTRAFLIKIPSKPAGSPSYAGVRTA